MAEENELKNKDGCKPSAPVICYDAWVTEWARLKNLTETQVREKVTRIAKLLRISEEQAIIFLDESQRFPNAL